MTPAATTASPPASIGMDRLLTYEDLEKRWRITGANARQIRQTIQRRCQQWGLCPMAGTRGDLATFRPVDVLKAEAFAAR